MLKYNNHTLKKVTTLFEELDYMVRFEKGNFQSGYCIVENKNIVIVNKFYDIEAKVNTLIDIFSKLDSSEKEFTESSAKFIKLLKKEAYDKD